MRIILHQQCWCHLQIWQPSLKISVIIFILTMIQRTILGKSIRSSSMTVKSSVFWFLTLVFLSAPTGTPHTILWRRLSPSGDLFPSKTLQIIISGLPADTLPEARAAKPTGTVPFLLSRFFSYTGKRKKKKKRWSWAKQSSAICCSWSLFSCAFLGWVKQNSQGPDQSPTSRQGGPGPNAAGCGTSSSCWRSTWVQTLSM